MKQSQLLKTIEIPEKHDKMTVGKDPLAPRQARERMTVASYMGIVDRQSRA